MELTWIYSCCLFLTVFVSEVEAGDKNDFSQLKPDKVATSKTSTVTLASSSELVNEDPMTMDEELISKEPKTHCTLDSEGKPPRPRMILLGETGGNMKIVF